MSSYDEARRQAEERWRRTREAVESGRSTRAEINEALRRFHDEMERIDRALGFQSEATLPRGREERRGLSIRGLHRLEALDSALRHSVVPACFHNLRELAALTGERAGNAEFAEEVATHLDNLGLAEQQLQAFLARRTTGNRTIGEVFPDVRSSVEGALQDLSDLASRWKRATPSAALGNQIVVAVDRAVEALQGLSRWVSEQRQAVAPLLERLRLLTAEQCASREVILTLQVGEGLEEVRTFHDPDQVLGALAQLVTSACNHACLDTEVGARRISVTLARDPADPEAPLELLVDGSGPGVSRRDRRRLLEGGDSTRAGGQGRRGLGLVQDTFRSHAGEVELDASPLGGLRVRCLLPVHLPVHGETTEASG